MDKKKNGHGGKRQGSGRKPAEHPRRRHTIYCNEEELYCIKAMILELRKIDDARKAVNKEKGKKKEYDIATDKWIEIENKVNDIKIGKFRHEFKRQLFSKMKD